MKSIAPVMAIFLVLLLFVSVSWGCALIGAPPPNIPHSPSGDFSDCAGCHIRGEQGAPVTDHIKKAECLTCHKTSSAGGGSQ